MAKRVSPTAVEHPPLKTLLEFRQSAPFHGVLLAQPGDHVRGNPFSGALPAALNRLINDDCGFRVLQQLLDNRVVFGFTGLLAKALDYLLDVREDALTLEALSHGYALPQRFAAALAAICERFFGVRAAALAAPPFSPPSRPNATAAGFFTFTSGGTVFGTSPMDSRKIWCASSFGSRGRMDFGMMPSLSQFSRSGQA
jgi:hypothetical protein